MMKKVKNKNMRPLLRHTLVSVALLASSSALAQTAPDAGRVLQEFVIPPEPIAPSVEIKMDDLTPASEGEPGGVQVEVKEIRFQGMTKINEVELKAVLADAIGASYDMAGLRRLANRITIYYREQSFPFARAYLPPQRMQDGVLQIEILEGRYGKVSVVGEESMIERSEQFLSDLKLGEAIEAAPLERATLILADLPGVELSPTMKPGEEVGAGDLEVMVGYGPRIEGKVGADNHGNRYTGQARALGAININSPFMLGDQLKASALYTEENMWFGQMGYALPLGTSGLRGEISYAHTDYQLGKEFESIDATGTADITSVGVSYPLIRSRSKNLLLSANYQHKKLEDKFGSVDVKNNKSSDSLPISLQFDARDQLGGGGITYGVFTWTTGQMSLDSENLRLQDRLTAKSHGNFRKYNIDIARLQRLSQSFTLFGRISGQYTDDNLDSSETMSLGGANGVRAYPQGEGNGDRGVLGQFELRYGLEWGSPYIFYDAGAVKVNVDPWATGENHRSIAGAGLGLRINYKQFAIDSAVAWITEGKEPESDSKDETPRFWLKAEYIF
jgi:hemolysin activation/secretion protein